ncbi:MAG TPA: 2-C-methyl-D-erythritol 4-phosphate cytidylyltransferase [Candidatus Alistipes stercoravium]|nr:2-C-methyl-D-erythritol 4-phosphate cytidylyltransferase [Candidatus Alistipes stercoravium]
MERTGVIIVAGGSGTRCGGTLPKQFALLGGMPVLARTINVCAEALPGAEIVVVLPERYTAFWTDFAARFDVAKHHTATGGAERFDSVRRGIEALRSDPELIAVQDGVRPLASVGMIRRVAADAAHYGAAIPVIAAVDSLREVEADAEGRITASHIVDRRRFRSVQTPQIFRAELLRKAYDRPYRADFTDDASVVEAAGGSIHLSEGERSNLKITTPEDFILAEALLAAREETAEAEKERTR